jgi:regulator of protease activity HflC (stomatin/prohibitin superfamily)
LIASSLKIAKHWEKAVVSRMGKFHRLRGPGFFVIIPIIERVNSYIDHRVRVTDIKAVNTLTKDTVLVFVDVIIYWVVGDAQRLRWKLNISKKLSHTPLKQA